MKRIALGTAQFGLKYGIANSGGRVSINEAERIVERARSSGIGMLDTAMTYGDSEQRLGEIGIRNWQVVSKLPAVPRHHHDTSQWVRQRLRGSLQRLGIDSLYGLLLHHPHQLLDEGGDRIYQALQDVKSEGLVQRVGVSVYEPTELEALSAYPFDLIQAPFSVMDRRLVNSGWLSRVAARGQELHVRSIFLQGLLLMQPHELPSAFARWVPLWSAWHEWLTATGLTPVQVCVQHVLSYSEISKVVIGVDTVRQFDEIAHAIAGPSWTVSADLQSSDVDLLNPSRWPRQ